MDPLIERNLDQRTSNDLWFQLIRGLSDQQKTYETVAQSAAEVQDLQNSPAISIGPYLILTGQAQLLTTISIYSERGTNAEQVRLLYMNQPALSVWRAMGRLPTMIGSSKRPPRSALLAYGVPFSL